MSLDPIELADAQRVELGGKTYLLPKLVWKQIKAVVPAIDAFRIRHLEVEKSGGAYTEADLDAMTRLVWIALTRAQPALTLADLEGLPFGVADLAALVPKIAVAAGLMGKAPLPKPATTEAESPSLSITI